jgi:O-antigen/teichoic acid export membrane protein
MSMEPLPAVELEPAGIELVPTQVAPAARPAAQRSLIYLVGSLISGNMLATFFRMVGGLLQARLVSPDTLGLFNAAGLVIGYLPAAQLGVANGLNRELPFFIGKGDRQRVNALAAAAQAWIIINSALAGGLFLLIAAWFLLRGDLPLAAVWATNALVAVYTLYGTYYLQITYRTGSDFARLAFVNVVQNAAALVFLAFVVLWSFYGICLRTFLSTAVAIVLLYYWRPIHVAPKWSLEHLKHLAIIGAPIFGVGVLYSWWIAINSTLVFTYMGKHGMGLYAMVLVVGTTLEIIPNAVGQVLYPRLAEHYGRNDDRRVLFGMATKPLLLATLGMIPVVAVCWWLVGPATQWLLPNYIDAVPAMRWVMLVPLVGCLTPISLIFNVVRRQDLFATSLIIGIAVYAGCLLWFVRDGAALTDFPQAMLVGQTVFTGFCYLLAFRLTHRSPAKS